MLCNQTILAVDDTKENLDLIIKILDGYDIIPATSGKEALEILKDEDVSLILLDINMPEMDGFTVCEIVKNTPATKDIPIIFITASNDETNIAKAFDIGGDDYITKPMRAKELLARVKIQLRLKQNIAELEYLASRDSMTGIYNRRKFFELATKMFEEGRGDVFASMIDIDDFKKINDKYGHDVGDRVIKLTVETMKKVICGDAIFGRLGGEEFAVVCNKHTKDEILRKYEILKNEIASLEVENSIDVLKFTISNGVAQKSETTKNIDELLKEADMALYDAKNSGKNRVRMR